MAGSKTNAHENRVLDHFLRDSGTVYLMLLTADPTEAGTTTSEVADSAYVRKAIAFNAASGGSTANSGEILFEEIADGEVTITHWMVVTATVAGDVHYHGNFDNPRTYNIGEAPVVHAGDIICNEG